MRQIVEVVRKEVKQRNRTVFKDSTSYVFDLPREIAVLTRGVRAQYVRLKVDITADNLSELIEVLQEMYPVLKQGG